MFSMGHSLYPISKESIMRTLACTLLLFFCCAVEVSAIDCSTANINSNADILEKALSDYNSSRLTYNEYCSKKGKTPADNQEACLYFKTGVSRLKSDSIAVEKIIQTADQQSKIFERLSSPSTCKSKEDREIAADNATSAASISEAAHSMKKKIFKCLLSSERNVTLYCQ